MRWVWWVRCLLSPCGVSTLQLASREAEFAEHVMNADSRINELTRALGEMQRELATMKGMQEPLIKETEMQRQVRGCTLDRCVVSLPSLLPYSFTVVLSHPTPFRTNIALSLTLH